MRTSSIQADFADIVTRARLKRLARNAALARKRAISDVLHCIGETLTAIAFGILASTAITFILFFIGGAALLQ